MSTPDLLGPLHAAHVQHLQHRTQALLERSGYGALILGSGHSSYYFLDDSSTPHKTNPHFAWWLPFEKEECWVVIRPGRKPLFVHMHPADYWHDPKGIPLDAHWAPQFDIVEVTSPTEALQHLHPATRTAVIHPAAAPFADQDWNPPALISALHWERSFKTPYEIHCMEQASLSAVKGHSAARKAFFEGASEREIHYIWLQATQHLESELPYTTIVGLDSHSAVLHWHGKDTTRNGKVFLLDAGTRFHGYASDITRTHVTPEAHPVFAHLLSGLEREQQTLCQLVRPGQSYIELHLDAHRRIAGLLTEAGVLKCSLDEALSSGLTRSFFPHGLGHHLGLQVHDVAGKQSDAAGTPLPNPKDHPTLRTTRPIASGHVLTIEPGIYFIPMLLDPLRHGPLRKWVNWDLVDALIPMGGMRIEDNVLATDSESRNLTRLAASQV